jgi:hypothetical protein
LGRNWIAELDNCTSFLRAPHREEASLEQMYELAELFNTFAAESMRASMSIIADRDSKSKQSIKEVFVGGRAGGQKFMDNNLFFKFPRAQSTHSHYKNTAQAIKTACTVCSHDNQFVHYPLTNSTSDEVSSS